MLQIEKVDGSAGCAASEVVGICVRKVYLLRLRRAATMKLNYVIEFVADMDNAVKFYRDTIGLSLKFQSPGWSEFSTGETSLGLHPASEKNPAGSIELGFNVANLGKFHQEMSDKGVRFSMPPTKQDFGGILAQFVDSEGRSCSVAEESSYKA
jgi:predicted enzyme related to lactoylglutathione lyase